MTDRLSNNPVDYIRPLNINKLEGRMMYIPAPKGKNREFLLVCAHHGMLERHWSLAENFSEYGSVTMPDLPGFGGMDSFDKIGLKPNLDAYADYLAAFLKLRFKRKKITFVGVGYGFLVITRMFQKYPYMTKKVDLLIAENSFMHKDDFVYSVPKRLSYRYGARVLGYKPLVLAQKLFLVNYHVIKFVYERLPESKIRAQKATKEEKEAMLEFEAKLWQVNDLRTNWLTLSESLNIDMCGSRVNLPVFHVVSKSSPYLNNDIAKEHMQIVFTSYKSYLIRGKTSSLSIIADKKEAGLMLPPALRKQLIKSR